MWIYGKKNLQSDSVVLGVSNVDWLATLGGINSIVLKDDDVGWSLSVDSIVEVSKVDNKPEVVVKGKEALIVVWTSGDISDVD